MKLMHLTKSEFIKGDILTPQEDGYCHMEESQALEQVLEMFRPKNKIARKNAVYLFDKRNGDSDFGASGDGFILVVDCDDETQFQKSDMNWIHELDQGFEDISVLLEDYTLEELKMLADGYWSGEVRFKDTPSVFEYRVNEAVVTSVYENNVGKFPSQDCSL